MEFSSVLDEKFRGFRSFAGTFCGERYVKKVDGSVFSKWCDGAGDAIFCAYRLAGCHTLAGEEVRAGFFIMKQTIVAYGYEAGEKFSLELVRRPLEMDDLDRVLGLLVNALVKDGNVVSDVVYRLKNLPMKEALLASFANIACKETGNKVFKLDGVVVNFGFDTMPFSMFFGCSGGIFAACLADSFKEMGSGGNTTYTSEYETAFASLEEGNAFFVFVKQGAVKAANGKVIYRVPGEQFFKYFYKVHGVVLRAGDILCG